MGGRQQGHDDEVNSVLLLNLASSNKQWRKGTPLNMRRCEHAAVMCNGGVYVMGGFFQGNLDCMERIDSIDLLQSSSTSSSTCASNWVTMRCRLSMPRSKCCAVAVHNRYIVVMGGTYNRLGNLSSVDIIDTSNHTVTAGPRMNVPRSFCASAVIGHRIFVAGGRNYYGNLVSLEYLEFAQTCENDKTKAETVAKGISFSSTWTTHSKLALIVARLYSCTAAAVGSSLIVAGCSKIGEVVDTHCNRVWNLPTFRNPLTGCSMVTVANKVVIIGGAENPTCATLVLMDRNSWCFRRLCEQQPYHIREGMGIRHADISSVSMSTSKSV